jgi:hypothetical protein
MMKRITLLLLLTLAGTLQSTHAQSQEPESTPDRTSSGPSFDAFRIIVDRNIFDPNRRERRPEMRTGPTRPRVQLPPTEQFSLAGVLIHDQSASRTAVAFFTGSRSDYSGSRELGETIAGLTVAAIRTDRIYLDGSGRRIELPVGRGLRRQGDEPWEVVAGMARPTRPSVGPPSRSGFDSRSRSSSSSAAPTGDNSDVLKALMERRRRQSMGETGSARPEPTETADSARRGPGDEFGQPGGEFGPPGEEFGRPGGEFEEPGGEFGRPGDEFAASDEENADGESDGDSTIEPSDESTDDILRELMERRRQERNR